MTRQTRSAVSSSSRVSASLIAFEFFLHRLDQPDGKCPLSQICRYLAFGSASQALLGKSAPFGTDKVGFRILEAVTALGATAGAVDCVCQTDNSIIRGACLCGESTISLSGQFVAAPGEIDHLA